MNNPTIRVAACFVAIFAAIGVTSTRCEDVPKGSLVKSLQDSGSLPSDTPLRTVTALDRALSVPNKEDQAFAEHMAKWAGKLVNVGAKKNPSVADLDVQVQAPQRPPPDEKEKKKVHDALFDENEVPTSDYALFLTVQGPLEQLEEKIRSFQVKGEKVPEELTVQKKILLSSLNAMPRGLEFAALHAKYSELYRRTKEVREFVVNWAPPVQNWQNDNGWVRHSQAGGSYEVKLAMAIDRESVEIPPNFGRIVGVVLIRNVKLNFGGDAYKSRLKAIAEALSKEKDYWYDNIPIITFDEAKPDIANAQIWVTASGRGLEWPGAFLVAAIIERRNQNP